MAVNKVQIRTPVRKQEEQQESTTDSIIKFLQLVGAGTDVIRGVNNVFQIPNQNATNEARRAAAEAAADPGLLKAQKEGVLSDAESSQIELERLKEQREQEEAKGLISKRADAESAQLGAQQFQAGEVTRNKDITQKINDLTGENAIKELESKIATRETSSKDLEDIRNGIIPASKSLEFKQKYKPTTSDDEGSILLKRRNNDGSLEEGYFKLRLTPKEELQFKKLKQDQSEFTKQQSIEDAIRSGGQSFSEPEQVSSQKPSQVIDGLELNKFLKDNDLQMVTPDLQESSFGRESQTVGVIRGVDKNNKPIIDTIEVRRSLTDDERQKVSKLKGLKNDINSIPELMNQISDKEWIRLGFQWVGDMKPGKLSNLMRTLAENERPAFGKIQSILNGSVLTLTKMVQGSRPSDFDAEMVLAMFPAEGNSIEAAKAKISVVEGMLDASMKFGEGPDGKRKFTELGDQSIDQAIQILRNKGVKESRDKLIDMMKNTEKGQLFFKSVLERNLNSIGR